jgi:hypothetical protein
LERWFSAYPDEHKPDLRARYRSGRQSDHLSAFFELYLHQLLCRLGNQVQVHPDVAHSSSRPDFLARTACGESFYLEAILAHAPSVEAEATEKRVAEVYDCLNRMDSPNFFLAMNLRGSPASPPKAARLRRELEHWLASLDPDHIAELYRADEGSVPRLPWNHDGWRIEFKPIPKSPGGRGKPGIRPLGTFAPEGRLMNTREEIRRAIKTKVKKYGRLQIPLVIAINFLDHCDHIDILDALFGDEQTIVHFSQDGEVAGQSPTRASNGMFAPQRNRRVSAVAVAADVSPWTMGSVTPELVHHPWAYVPISSKSWPMPQWVGDLATGKIKRCDGTSAAAVLDLPTPWPVSQE